MNKENLQLLLTRSLEESLNLEEQALLHQALNQSADFRQEKKELLQIQATLSNHEMGFKPFFVGRVMTQIEQLAKRAKTDFFDELLFAFRRVAMPSLSVIVLLLAYTYFTEGALTLDTILGLSEMDLAVTDSNWDVYYALGTE
ncbi:MAG: hypothetical protein ACPGXL_06445 [Chitinophagales bacterium]